MKFVFLIPLFPLLGFLFNFFVGVRALRIVLVSSSRFVKFLKRAWKASRVRLFSSSLRSSSVRSRRSVDFIGLLHAE